uniref:SOSS complex subunit C n=1 Tax=Gopherus agassizii TaxID=38772 RepID=A0A452H1Q7_9SAUR
MAANPPSQGFQNKNRVAILAELDKEKRKLLMQNQSSTNHPGARVLQPFCQTSDLPIMKNMDPCIALARSSLNKDFRDHAEQQHIAAQQKAALQVSGQILLHLVLFLFSNPGREQPCTYRA